MFICRGTLELPIQIKTNSDKEKLTIPTPTCVRSMLVQQPLNVQKEKKTFKFRFLCYCSINELEIFHMFNRKPHIKRN